MLSIIMLHFMFIAYGNIDAVLYKHFASLYLEGSTYGRKHNTFIFLLTKMLINKYKNYQVFKITLQINFLSTITKYHQWQKYYELHLVFYKPGNFPPAANETNKNTKTHIRYCYRKRQPYKLLIFETYVTCTGKNIKQIFSCY